MATDSRQRTTWGSRFRFAVRALGLMGLLACTVGGVLLGAEQRERLSEFAAPGRLEAVAQGAEGEFLRAATLAVLVGAGLAALTLVLELLSALLFGGFRRTAAGTSATLGTVAAVALLAFVNVYSFTHYRRIDCTRDQRFTLPAELQTELGKLRPNAPTTIVVLQMHNFGTLAPKRDSYTKAAEEKVTEKVRDLVDQFREFGPQFNVVVLDSEAFGYEDQVRQLTKDAPELKGAIDDAPENSIFFHANGRVQRLSFNEFMQLDKTASKEAPGAENLVLLPQGVDTFARRVLTVQERRPKVAVCVVHEFLSTAVAEGTEQYTVAGLKRALTDNGFDVVDVVLKKNWEDPTKEIEPAAYTLDESKLERLEAEADSARDAVQGAKDDVKVLTQLRAALDTVLRQPVRDRVDFYNQLGQGARVREWTELIAAFRRWTGGPQITAESEAELQGLVRSGLAVQLKRSEEQVREAEAEQRDAEGKVKAAQADERTVQDRRIADVKAKLTRLVSDVDLLIVPRHTLVNVSIRNGVPPAIHQLDKKQVEVVKEFMKAGKPVLACMGSLASRTGPPAEGDGFDRLLRDRGVELKRDTVLFDAERKALASARAGGQIGGGGPTTIPPLVFAEGAPAGSSAAPNPIAAALRHSGRTVEQKLDIKLFSPRPVYLADGWQDKLKFAGEFVFTAPAGWNEEKPFPTSDQAGRVTYIPRYDPTPADDPKRNTRAEERKGSFPIGVAVESKIPAAWVNESYEREQGAAALLSPLDGTFAAGLSVAAAALERPTQRTVVFGSGHLFSGPRLEPPQERLLLHSVNWLTGREDRLPKADVPAWKYPRVELSERNRALWRSGALIGLPLIAAYAGLFAMMRRRTR
ncbi:hypothetical protein R5W24_004524 [Gemmata sp. JC717]|uniref:hypothetical protein n=1 Tax=Gemmata algarum TaxID=2975278 RepID=UPI0021BA7E59|nr:hypothetical protein [Gemmata algarum]MDY3555381.1 hypothetical protein [Gemmata algarum]